MSRLRGLMPNFRHAVLAQRQFKVELDATYDEALLAVHAADSFNDAGPSIIVAFITIVAIVIDDKQATPATFDVLNHLHE